MSARTKSPENLGNIEIQRITGGVDVSFLGGRSVIWSLRVRDPPLLTDPKFEAVRVFLFS